jgi:sugar lactone lactonase YvrE
VPGNPSGLGWLPDGRMLVVSMGHRQVLRRQDDGTLVRHADLSAHEGVRSNDMTVGPDGRAWVGGFGFDLLAGAEARATVITTVDPDGTTRVAAEGLMFPNGMVLDQGAHRLIVAETMAGRLSAFDVGDDGTLNRRRTFAEVDGMSPDGICGDAEGAVWAASPLQHAVLRVREGGEVVDRIETGDRLAIACMLGGSDRRTLHVLTAEVLDAEEARQRRSARVEVVEVEVPGAGWP